MFTGIKDSSLMILKAILDGLVVLCGYFIGVFWFLIVVLWFVLTVFDGCFNGVFMVFDGIQW